MQPGNSSQEQLPSRQSLPSAPPPFSSLGLDASLTGPSPPSNGYRMVSSWWPHPQVHFTESTHSAANAVILLCVFAFMILFRWAPIPESVRELARDRSGHDAQPVGGPPHAPAAASVRTVPSQRPTTALARSNHGHERSRAPTGRQVIPHSLAGTAAAPRRVRQSPAPRAARLRHDSREQLRASCRNHEAGESQAIELSTSISFSGDARPPSGL